MTLSFAAFPLAIAAAALPSLLAWNVSPSPTFLNQALALALWGAFVAASGRLRAPTPAWPLLAALVLVGAAVALSWGPGGLPSTLALSALGMLAAAMLMVASGAGAVDRSQAQALFVCFCWAWLITGLVNVALGAVQVFAPQWADGRWIAHSTLPGRAVGNLRQPNHLSSLLLWSAVAVVALIELRRLARPVGAGLMALLVFAVVLTASRTGLISVLLLAVWGLLDRRLAGRTRGLLLATPLLYGLCWWGMAQWAAASAHGFGGAQRLAETDISGSRFAIWADTLAMIRLQPWTGVGFGEFNLAWTLTPFPGRPTAFFDHTHNLPLQLVVELGLPLAGLVTVLLCWALLRGARQAWRAEGDAGTLGRCALVMVLMIGLHSQLEYPLWYAYFLLPAAWVWGAALGRQDDPGGPDATPGRGRPWTAWLGSLLVLGAVASVLDYQRVVHIFYASETGGPSLEARIANGQRSVFFGHHADYAAVTSSARAPDARHDFNRTAHYLMDTRLMIAWSKALAEAGELDAARHLAARLREFRKAEAADFFAACPNFTGKAGAAPLPGEPFQCAPPSAAVPWRSYLPRASP